MNCECKKSFQKVVFWSTNNEMNKIQHRIKKVQVKKQQVNLVKGGQVDHSRKPSQIPVDEWGELFDAAKKNGEPGWVVFSGHRGRPRKLALVHGVASM